MTIAIIALVWLIAAVIVWFVGQIPSVDGELVRIGRAVVIILLIVWSVHASGILSGHVVKLV